MRASELFLIVEQQADKTKELIKNVKLVEHEHQNAIIEGDNFDIMLKLLPFYKGKIDLIYIDPPYMTGKDFKNKSGELLYSDKFTLESYFKMITPRLVLMRELLSDKGSIYVHIDWHVGHYVKLILDEIFGRENFVNEVIWAYRTGGSSKGNWSQKHDNIYFYKKSITHIFNTQLEKAYTKSKSRKAGIVNYGAGNAEFFEDENGVYNLVNARDIWEISYINSQSSERTGYSTQKPVELLERIIKASSNEESVVADFFCGSGTTAAVAEKLGRRWITTDLGKPACMITRKRLIDNNAKPFLYQHVGNL